MSKVPKHIGIILDGNRRFARKLMMKPWMGHEWGAKKAELLFDWCKELGINELTLYCFSIENFNRPKDEFDFLMNLFKKEFAKLLTDKRIYDDKIKVNFIGRLWMLPKDLQEILHNVMEKTKLHNNYIVNFAIAYGGRTEVIDAIKKIAEDVKDGKLDINKINEDVFSKNLYNDSEPDLIIRTGGDHRTSNFLIWQATYSEWLFLEKTWPEFEKQDLLNAIENFSKRERRFGR